MIKKVFFSVILIFLTSVKSNALIEVDITRGNLDPLPIAVSHYRLIKIPMIN